MVGNPPGWQRFTGTFAVSSTAVAPAAGQAVTDTGALPAGVYRVSVSGSYGGTADTIDNMALFRGDKQVTHLPVIPVANSVPIIVELPAFRVNEGERLTVQPLSNGGAGSVFRGIIVATPVQSQDFL